MTSATPKQATLGYIRKQDEWTMGNKPVSHNHSWPLHGVQPPGSCLEFLPFPPFIKTTDYKSQNPPLCKSSIVFIRAIGSKWGYTCACMHTYMLFKNLFKENIPVCYKSCHSLSLPYYHNFYIYEWSLGEKKSLLLEMGKEHETSLREYVRNESKRRKRAFVTWRHCLKIITKTHQMKVTNTYCAGPGSSREAHTPIIFL